MRQMAGEVTRHLYAARLKEARAEPLLGRSLRCLVDRHLFSDRDSSVQPKVLQQQTDPKALTRLRRTGQGRVRELWASLGRHFDSGMGESPVMESELYRDGPETFAKRSCFEQVSDSVPPWGGEPFPQRHNSQRLKPRLTCRGSRGVQMPRFDSSAPCRTSSVSSPVQTDRATSTTLGMDSQADVATSGTLLLLSPLSIRSAD